jgi:glycosyltransferase involved in cell wall biosynthesis
MVKPIISFIIPVFQNEGTIGTTFTSLRHLFSNHLLEFEFECIFVNDGSTDGSWNEIIQLSQKDSRVKAISFSRNFGQVAAMIAGAKYARGAAAIFLSADLQDPIELIEDMMRDWSVGKSEIVICYRTERADSIAVRITSAIFYRFMKFANPMMPKGGFDFVLLDRKPLEVYTSIDNRNRFFQGDILWMGFKVKFIPYQRLKRSVGKSQWSFSKKLKYFIDGALSTSLIPIRLMSAIGITSAFLGIIYAFVSAYMYFIYDVPFNGYTSIILLLLILGGLIMLMLGIIGEYLARIYDETRKKPIYIINEYID